MRNPNKPICDIDETQKSKNEIAEMISNMMKTDEDGYAENKGDNKKTA